jgi:hypothetical protein
VRERLELQLTLQRLRFDPLHDGKHRWTRFRVGCLYQPVCAWHVDLNGSERTEQHVGCDIVSCKSVAGQGYTQPDSGGAQHEVG